MSVPTFIAKLVRDKFSTLSAVRPAPENMSGGIWQPIGAWSQGNDLPARFKLVTRPVGTGGAGPVGICWSHVTPSHAEHDASACNKGQTNIVSINSLQTGKGLNVSMIDSLTRVSCTALQ